MLERYFLFPTTVDRIRASWIAGPIERYVAWMTERAFAVRSVVRRVPLLLQFGDFARHRGARRVRELPKHVDAFVRAQLRRRARRCRSPEAKRVYTADLRRPIEQMLRVVQPARKSGRRTGPFAKWVPDFFAHLREERGLKDATIQLYRHYLARFEVYASKHRIRRPDKFTPASLDGFVAEQRRRISADALGPVCAALRALLRYAFREGLMQRDLSGAVEAPRTYALSHIPRSINWDDVLRALEGIDRRFALGKRDYAILSLLAVYGLRAREVAA